VDVLPFQLLQMADSACPTGGFAHSYGVEELFRERLISDAGELLEFVSSYVVESLPGRELVFVALAWDAATEDDVATLVELAQTHVATRLTRAARESEGVRGRALQRTLEAVHGPSPYPDEVHTSYAVLFGTAGALFGADRQSVLRASAFSYVSAMTQAAVRLGRIGPIGAQQVLGRLADPMAQAVADSAERRFGDWHGFSPLWELAQTRHEHHPSSMFAT
jgi:urease accessory protein